MQIEVPLTLTIEVSSKEKASAYLELAEDGALTSKVSLEFLADLFDDGIPDIITYDSDAVLKVCGKTQQEVETARASKIP